MATAKNMNNDHHDETPGRLSQRFIEHANQPRNVGMIENADGKATGVGTCGDIIEVYLLIRNDIITDLRQFPRGCTYTVACGSAMSQLVKGKRLPEALDITPGDVARELDGLPEDHMHCAALAVNTLGEAIDDFYQKAWGNLPRT